MEVKSRKKSNLYDSIKKDNRCIDTVCGKMMNFLNYLKGLS